MARYGDRFIRPVRLCRIHHFLCCHYQLIYTISIIFV
jgi:hypothetical protein